MHEYFIPLECLHNPKRYEYLQERHRQETKFGGNLSELPDCCSAGCQYKELLKNQQPSKD